MPTSRQIASKLPQPHRSLDEGLDESTGFLISDTARHVKRLLYGRIAKQGIRGGTWFVLRALWVQDGVTQRELANLLGMTQPSTLEMLRTMEVEGLVRYERDSVDRRKLRIYVTDAGLALKAPALKIAAEANEILLSGLSQAEEILLKVMLRTVRSAAAQAIAELKDESSGQASSLDARSEAREAEVNVRTRKPAEKSVSPKKGVISAGRRKA